MGSERIAHTKETLAGLIEVGNKVAARPENAGEAPSRTTPTCRPVPGRRRGDPAPIWATALAGSGEFAAEMYSRSHAEDLGAHLEEVYGIEVSKIEELDLGVHRVDRRGGPSWIARVFSRARAADYVAGDAKILDFLAARDYPSERCAAADPVSLLDGQAVLVTEYMQAVPPAERADEIRGLGGYWSLGSMLGRLHTMPDATAAAGGRPGGCWHHLGDGAPSVELAEAQRVLALAESAVAPDDRGSVASLQDQLADLDSGDGLPEALVHPDFVLQNVIVSKERGMVLVDWTGAGRAPRVWSLALLLLSAAARGGPRLERVVGGYSEHVHLEPEELLRLPKVMRARPVVLEAWAFCMGRKYGIASGRSRGGPRSRAPSPDCLLGILLGIAKPHPRSRAVLGNLPGEARRLEPGILLDRR